MTDKKITLWIDNEAVEVDKGMTVLEAAEKIGRDIPTLCYLKEINEIGACRMCIVEDEKTGAIKASCITPAVDGMRIKTNSNKIRKTDNCELNLLAKKMGIRDKKKKKKKQIMIRMNLHHLLLEILKNVYYVESVRVFVVKFNQLKLY